ncbi:probable beta-1,3-galactosyltransferase 13 isoform X3 [Aristolochia californica]|uniref:probable beta-1,3-galactosyltransferase 13 isoform X3 n=1 Tax=Aristolochia californica TaxID=171875 RepID=UPI0035D6796F
MPSSPKFFYARQSWLSQSRRTTLSLVCFILGIAGTIFGLIAIFTPLNGYRCRDSVPRSVSVAWVSETDVADRNSGDTASQKRFKVMGFVGIQTGFRSAGRRASLRKTWMPSDNRGLQRLEESTGLAFRFVIGRTNDVSKMLTLRREIATYDDFMLLDIEEEYRNLPHKTLAFFKASYALYDAEFYVKADDDIYLRPDRLSLLLSKERPNRQTYLGCMKKGPVFTDPNLKWSVAFRKMNVETKKTHSVASHAVTSQLFWFMIFCNCFRCCRWLGSPKKQQVSATLRRNC